MPELIDREVTLQLLDKSIELFDENTLQDRMSKNGLLAARRIVSKQPTIEPEVRHGRWIECDYKHMEHGMIETEPNAGLCCSECRTAFQKKKMTYKQYCAACGARMDAEDINVLAKDGGADNG